MRAVAVRRLTLRVPSGRLAASRQRAQDALYLSAPDETRLVILRWLELGRLSADAGVAAWTDRAARTLAARRARAVHGGQPGADAADAVWFRSVEEARSLLLLLLASGRVPSAWFWSLAVPDWQGAPLTPWIATWMRHADFDPATALALARAVVMAVRAGHAAAIMAALAAPAMPSDAAGLVNVTTIGTKRRAIIDWRAADARAVMNRHDAPTQRDVLRALAQAPAGAAASVRLAQYALLAVAPELAGDAARSSLDLAHALLAALHDPAIPPPAPEPLARTAWGAAEAGPRPGEAGAAAGGVSRGRPEPDHPSMPRTPGMTIAADTPGADPSAARANPPDSTARAEPDVEQQSSGAGVLLAIQALDRLGLGGWSAADARHAADGFGRHLLCHIARRARLPPEDCLFAMLEAPDTMPDADALQAWRVGLDRWLRRRTRLRLADLTHRRGWLLRVEATLLVRFPVQAAELRLRRLALDIDPGWVPWLGLSVRYHFSDTALA